MNLARDSTRTVTICQAIPSLENECLIREVTEEEILQEIKLISSLKTPTPVGMPIIFYQKRCNILGKNIYRMVKAFLHHGHLLREINNTHIPLIPKKEKYEKVNDCRPISLCNVSYNFFRSYWLIGYIWYSQN